MKKIRIAKILDEESYNDVIMLYLEAKTNKNITQEEFLIFKSFLTKMIYAQSEYMDCATGEQTFPSDSTISMSKWKTPHQYFTTMKALEKKETFIKGIVKRMINSNFRPFNFDYKKHFGILI